MQDQTEILSKLLRDMETEFGTRDVAKLTLESVISSIENFKVDSAAEFCNQFETLVQILTQTEPKFGVLNFYFKELLKTFKEKVCNKDVDHKKWKKLAIDEIEKFLKKAKDNKKLLLEQADQIDVEGKTILIHDHSHTVQDVLVHYKTSGKHFKVVIAEQDFEKTHSNIEKMHNAGIPFQVVPAYMISHVHDTIDMVFFGALTLKDTMHFVMDPGAHGVISEFHVEGTPIFLFIDTTKFSLWKSKERGEIFIHQHKRTHLTKAIEYERIKYSHDRVPAKLFKKIITNEGIFTPESLEKLFEKKLKEYSKDEKTK